MILMYHKIALEAPTLWWVTADAFWLQMEQLLRYTVVPLSNYDPLNPRHVVITFDGVYENVYTYTLPILRRFGYPFELFVIGDMIGKGNEFDQPVEPPARFASVVQLKTMVKHGGRLQWHSRTHQDLSELKKPQLDSELKVPEQIRDLDAVGFRWFAYPNGRLNPSLIEETRRCFEGAVSCVAGNNTDRFQLNRVTVTNDTSFAKSSVSLIIPNYNYGRLAAEAIESALAQTVPPNEILFIDDCSQDNSMEVVERYKDRIQVVRNEKNLGIIDNFNKAVSLTSGDYICFLGADNRFRSDYVERCKLLLDVYPGAAIVYTNVVFFGLRAEIVAVKLGIDALPNSKDMFLWRFPEFNEGARDRLKYGNFIHGSSMYRRQAFHEVGGYVKSEKPEDHNLFFSMVEKGWKAILCPEFLLEYRQHSNEQADARFNNALELAHVRQQLKTLNEQLDQIRSIEQYQKITQLQNTVVALQNELSVIHRSLGWKVVNKLNQIKNNIFPLYTRRRNILDLILRYMKGLPLILRLMKVIATEGTSGFINELRLSRFEKGHSDDPSYNSWIFKNEPDKSQLRAMRLEVNSLSYQPKVSIITPVYNPNEYDLTECLKSVLNQVYHNWELCLVDGGSDKPYVKEVIKRFARKDPRIKYAFLPKNKGIAGNSNEALKLATGEYVAFLDHDDMLALFALYEVLKLLNQDSNIDFIYSDEDKVPPNGRERYGHYFKPDWSPDTFLSYNYICHFAVVRRELIEEVRGFREGYDGAQDYDLFLRILLKTTCIKRIPKILYHWRASHESAASNTTAKPYACAAAIKAIVEYLRNKGIEAEVLDGMFQTSYRVRYRIRQIQKVCIIIPTKDKVHLLKQCVSSIFSKTNYKHYEIIIVDNQSKEANTIDYLNNIKKDERVKILPYDKPFNFSTINNYAVTKTDAEYLLFLNNDTEVINSEWLSAMFEFCQRDDIGAVGAKLYYPDNTIQHAGVIIGLRGLAAHSHKGFSNSGNGYMGRLNIIQNVSAVTAACMMMRRKVFEEVGGFDESLSVAFNDVDLCLKVREKGYLIVYTPYAELYHHESASRGIEDKYKERFKREEEFMKTKWKDVIEAGDPYYNPNLILEKHDFSPGL